MTFLAQFIHNSLILQQFYYKNQRKWCCNSWFIKKINIITATIKIKTKNSRFILNSNKNTVHRRSISLKNNDKTNRIQALLLRSSRAVTRALGPALLGGNRWTSRIESIDESNVSQLLQLQAVAALQPIESTTGPFGPVTTGWCGPPLQVGSTSA